MFLNIKTEYNFLTSLCKIEDLIKFAKENNILNLGIVDQKINIGNLKFINLCNENSIKPIIGVNKNVRNSKITNVTFYAKNELGLEYLNKLAEEIERIEDIQSDNILMVININKFVNKGEVSSLGQIFKTIDIKNLYISYNENLLLGIDELNIDNEVKELILKKMIFDEEIHFLNENDIEAYTVLQSINNGTKYLEEKVNKVKYKTLSFEAKIHKLTHVDDKIKQNTISLIKQIDNYNVKKEYKDTLNFSQYNEVDFEKVLLDNLKTYLKVNSLQEQKEVYLKRLQHEISVIKELNFEQYFLIMQDIIDYCNQNNILYGYGRGSAAGSLVSFLLKITKIDPVKYNLYFERFLNLKRASLPDIDLDVSDIHRQQIIEYLIQKYGDNHVAKIYTINRYLVKSAFNDLVKSLDFNKEVAKNMSKNLNSHLSFEQNIEQNYKFFSKYLTDPKFDFLKDTISKIENLPKTTSIHAAGIVISSIDLNAIGYINKENNVIYNEAKNLEQNGFIKFDLLALTNLSFIDGLEKEVKKVNEQYNSDIPLNEPAVFKNLQKAKTFGIFQLESKGIRVLLTKYKPTKFEDIAIIISLYRPGPMQNIDTYLNNRRKFPNIKYIHEDLKSILEPTYGIFIYQEQIIEVVQKIASFTLQEADIFRVAISKKIAEKIEHEKEKFLRQGKENGYSDYVLNKIFEDIEKFADYGFNKAHAYSYARLIYQLMYIKSKYPTIFYEKLFKANINSNKREEFLLELYSNNIKILTPSIKHCSYDNIIARGQIELGVSNIKGVNSEKLHKIVDSINQLKKEKKVTKEEFLSTCIINSNLTKEEVSSLVHSGFLDDLNINRKSLETTLTKYNALDVEILKLTKESILIQEEEDYTFEQKMELEKKALNINIKYNPETYLIKKLTKKYPNENLTNLTFQNKDLQLYKDYFIIGTVIEFKEITTKTNEKMAFINIKHHNSNVELTCFKDEYKLYYEELLNKENLKIFKIQKSKTESLVLREIIN